MTRGLYAVKRKDSSPCTAETYTRKGELVTNSDSDISTTSQTNLVASAAPVSLYRGISLVGAIAIVAGSMIGSGIFITPASVLKNTGSIGLDLIVWIVCGVLSMIGALCYAELGTMIPKAGGDYTYLKTASSVSQSRISSRFFDIMAFLTSWSFLLLLDPLSTVLQSRTFTAYVLSLVYIGCDPPQLLTDLMCVTYIKPEENHVIVSTLFRGTNYEIGNVISAIYGALYAFAGWKSIATLSEEIRKPEKNILVAIVFGVALVSVLYVFTNLAYFVVLEKKVFLNSDAVAVTFARHQWGDWSASLMMSAVAISGLGAITAWFLCQSRVYFSAAREGHLWEALSYIQPSSGVPVLAVAIRPVFAIMFLHQATLQQLIEAPAFVEMFFECFVIASIFLFRSTIIPTTQVFRVPTILAVIRMLTCIFLVVMTLLSSHNLIQYVIIFVFEIFGLIAYYFCVYQKHSFPGTLKLTHFVQKLFILVPCSRIMLDVSEKTLNVL